MKLIDGLTYFQWQRRNSEYLKSLTKCEQKEVKKQGYFNKGWDKVRYSWTLILPLIAPKVISLFEHKLCKHDLTSAIKLSILEAEQTHQLAEDTLIKLKKNQEKMNKLVTDTFKKYTLL